MLQAIDKLQERFGHKPEDIFIWIDYSCIPQMNADSQLAAIDSIANCEGPAVYQTEGGRGVPWARSQ